jgi:hypothetical protein
MQELRAVKLRPFWRKRDQMLLNLHRFTIDGIAVLARSGGWDRASVR